MFTLCLSLVSVSTLDLSKNADSSDTILDSYPKIRSAKIKNVSKESNLAKLTAAEKAIATNKGWTLA